MHRRLDGVLAQPVPFWDFDGLAMVPTPEEFYVAKIFDRGLDFDPRPHALPVRCFDLLVGHFDEVRTLEHGGE